MSNFEELHNFDLYDNIQTNLRFNNIYAFGDIEGHDYLFKDSKEIVLGKTCNTSIYGAYVYLGDILNINNIDDSMNVVDELMNNIYHRINGTESLYIFNQNNYFDPEYITHKFTDLYTEKCNGICDRKCPQRWQSLTAKSQFVKIQAGKQISSGVRSASERFDRSASEFRVNKTLHKLYSTLEARKQHNRVKLGINLLFGNKEIELFRIERQAQVYKEH